MLATGTGTFFLIKRNVVQQLELELFFLIKRNVVQPFAIKSINPNIETAGIKLKNLACSLNLGKGMHQ